MIRAVIDFAGRVGTALLLGTLAVSAAWAESYPTRPVKLIVTFPPGGTPDIYGRLMAQELSALWKQSVVVENRTGASGTIGTDSVAKASPDGYTLLFASDATLTIAPGLFPSLPYDVSRDLVPIINVASGPFVMMAHPGFEVSGIKGLIEQARQGPDKITYASSGAGGQQHLAMALIAHQAEIRLTHVPYKGFGQGVQDVMAGHVPLIFGGITAAIQLSKSGKLKPIAVTSPRRSASMPEVPAVAETLPGFRIEAWYGFIGPQGLSRELVSRIHADVSTVLQRPDFRARIIADGMDPVGTPPDAFARQIDEEIREWSGLIRALRVKVD